MEESRSFVGDKRSLKRILVIKHRVANIRAPFGGQEQEAVTQMCKKMHKYNKHKYKDTQIYKYTNPRYINQFLNMYINIHALAPMVKVTAILSNESKAKSTSDNVGMPQKP